MLGKDPESFPIKKKFRISFFFQTNSVMTWIFRGRSLRASTYDYTNEINEWYDNDNEF